MSWVAELKATSQNKASVLWKKWSAGMQNAIPASPAPMSSCMEVIHHRFVRSKSTNGLHNGLITQGRFSQLVYKAISVFDMPIRLYITNEITMTATYGMPCAKYKLGIQLHADTVRFFFAILIILSYICSFIVMLQNFYITVSLLSHNGCTDLAQTNSMSPSGSGEYEPFGDTIGNRAFVYNKC